MALHQPLVQTNGAIDFATAAEQVAQRDLGLEGFLVQLGDMQEQLDRLVRLLVEQVVQAAEISARQAADLGIAMALTAAPADHPTAQGGKRKEQEKPEPLGQEVHCLSQIPSRGRGSTTVGVATRAAAACLLARRSFE